MDLVILAMACFALAFASICLGLWLGREAYHRVVVARPQDAVRQESYQSPDVMAMWPPEDDA